MSKHPVASNPEYIPQRRKCWMCREWFTALRRTQMECEDCAEDLRAKRMKELENGEEEGLED